MSSGPFSHDAAQMSFDHELANERARCSGKNASYLTNISCSLFNGGDSDKPEKINIWPHSGCYL